MNQKSIIAVLGVVVVILIGTTIYFATINKASQPVAPAPKVAQQPVPTPATQPVAPVVQPVDEFASWQTFTDAKLGIEVKYPSGYVAKIGDEKKTFDPSFYISNPSKVEVKGISHNYAFELNINSNFIGGTDGRAKNPTEWLAIQKESGDNFTKTIVGGQTAYVKDNKSGGVDSKEYAVFLSKGTMYDMYQIIIRKDDAGEKILSTLKFTK